MYFIYFNFSLRVWQIWTSFHVVIDKHTEIITLDRYSLCPKVNLLCTNPLCAAGSFNWSKIQVRQLVKNKHYFNKKFLLMLALPAVSQHSTFPNKLDLFSETLVEYHIFLLEISITRTLTRVRNNAQLITLLVCKNTVPFWLIILSRDSNRESLSVLYSM